LPGGWLNIAKRNNRLVRSLSPGKSTECNASISIFVSIFPLSPLLSNHPVATLDASLPIDLWNACTGWSQESGHSDHFGFDIIHSAHDCHDKDYGLRISLEIVILAIRIVPIPASKFCHLNSSSKSI
jgi:hypothetical protein